jgi:hypothetical protein
MKPVLSLLALGAAALAATACDDPFDVEAQLPTNVDTLAVFALNNGLGSYYSAVKIVTLDADGEYGPEVVPFVSETGGGPQDFDVVLDIAPDGRAIVYPLTLIAPGAANRRVGIMETELPFDQVLSAPRGTYDADEPVLLEPGDVIVIESPSQSCAFSANSKGNSFYAKLVVDSIRTSPVERIFVRATSDPNCGFRSFAEGIPGS